MEQLLVLPRYRELCKLFSGVGEKTDGISNKEIQHLSWLAYNVPVGGDVIDLGSHKGKSACAMGSALLEAKNDSARLFCIDLWTSGTTNFEHQRAPESFETFKKQIEKMGLTDRVKVLMTSSMTAVSKRGKPVHLIFIDASHKYADVLADYTAWSKFIPSGGRIAFHDYNSRFSGVQKVVDETVIPSGLWEDYRAYDHIWSATRI
jgi:predicted O-methyltransferase YrrM